MRNTLKVAARISCVCLSYVLFTGERSAAQTQATQPQTTQPQASGQAPAPPPAVKPAEDFYAGDGISLTLQYWLGTGSPSMGTGHGNGNGEPSTLVYNGTPRPSPGAILSIPIGKHNSLHVSYFRTQGNGNYTEPVPVIIYGTSYNQGDYLAVHYTLQNVKLSLDYLSWPFPVKDSKFHIKTLWEAQYTNIGSGIDAPLRHGQTDASGNPINVSAYGKDWFIYPSFGLGIDYLLSHNLRFEARASGFAFPHRATIWDTEASLNYRFGKFEIQGGVRAFHFKTSPLRVEFVQATLPGAYVGLRWYPEFSKR